MPRTAKNSSGAVSTAARQEQRKMRRGIILLVCFGLLLAGCGLLIYWLEHQFFDRNPRFTMERVELYNNGFWGKTAKTREDLLQRIQLFPGKQNLFALSPESLRQQLRSIANIADAEVERVLPDTIVIRLEERVPRAFIGYTNADFVVDSEGMVMHTRQCFGVHPKLPTIVGLRGEVKAGQPLPQTASALELIMQINRAFPEFQVDIVSVQPSEELFFKLKAYGRHYRVTIPRRNIPDMLDVLRSVVQECRKNHDGRSRINLSFDGHVVLGN